ncbi:MAG: M3 family metallopeptidase [Bacteroidales bacterium]|nr:M3 family metallopeptidase [Bacteroidales bacterium]
MNNPLIGLFNTPYQSFPFDKIIPGHIQPAFEQEFVSARSAIESIVANPEEPGFYNTIAALERAGYRLGRLSALLFNLNVAETNPEIQAAAREISPLLSDFHNDIVLNKDLFARIKKVYGTADKNMLSVEEKRLLEKTYTDFVRNGANLSDTDKAIYREVTKELATLSVDFDENVLAETNNYLLHITNKNDLEGLPDDMRTAAEDEAKSRGLEGWAFTLQFPSFGPFMKYADNRALRKEIYFAYNTRCLKNKNSNIEIIKRIASLRSKKASILGYKTYADFVLGNRMAESVENVGTFLNGLLNAAMPFAKKEYEELLEFANKNGLQGTLETWDWAYYSEKLRKEKFDIDDEMTRPYFQLEKVEEGVFQLAGTLFELSFKESKNIPVYHSDVKVFEVFDNDNTFLSLLYMDYFPRKGKKGGAWMTEYQQQHKTAAGENIRPHVSLVFNFSKPVGKKPSLLTFTEVTTMLHEFGHALHGMLSNCTFEELAGTNVYRDFVELPSQLLENWAEQKDWLDKVALHYKSGEKIPENLVNKIIESRNFNSGYFFVRQLAFGILDMKWHTLNENAPVDIFDFETKATAPAQVLPRVTNTALSPSFSHIFSGGYAAGYYSYKWAEVLDADAFAFFKEKGIFNKEAASKFRDCILSKGGTEHPMELYVRFRGQKPSHEHLLKRSGLK